MFAQLRLPEPSEQIPAQVSLEQCLATMLSGNEGGACPGDCGTLDPARQSRGFCRSSLPPVLVLSLDASVAFMVPGLADDPEYVSRKRQTLIHFTEDVDVAPYCLDIPADEPSAADTRYTLFAVGCHQGVDPSFGHNLALARDWDTNDWFIYNDSKVEGPLPFDQIRARTQIPEPGTHLEFMEYDDCPLRPFYFVYRRKC